MISLAGFWRCISALAALACNDERYSVIAFVPIISAGMVWFNRRTVFVEPRYCPAAGIPFLLGGIGLYVAEARKITGGADTNLCLAAFAVILSWTALFLLCHGGRALKRSAFPFLLLLFMVPLPAPLMNSAVIALQKASTDMTAGLFQIVRMPFFRDQFTFALPEGIHIRIAEECSGIRSSLSLLLSGLVAANLFLGSNRRRACFALLIIPVVIFKNAVRITMISWLGVYVDRSFFFGNLHHYGGIPFSAIAVAILGLALQVLRKSDSRPQARVA